MIVRSPAIAARRSSRQHDIGSQHGKRDRTRHRPVGGDPDLVNLSVQCLNDAGMTDLRQPPPAGRGERSDQVTPNRVGKFQR